MRRLSYLLGAGLLVVIDYFIKQWAMLSLKPIKSIDIFPDILSLTYHENFGAAFGILQNKQFFLVGVTSILLIGIVVAILMKKIDGHLLLSSFSLILAGGLGNLIDRVAMGYVVDYIYFEPINFPIFNFADSCVVVGTGLMIIYILFFDEKKENKPVEPESLEQEIAPLKGDGEI